MNVQWYPGHMSKTKKMMQENINLVDIIIELLDARIPYSSKNPDIDKFAGNKKRIIILNKSDLADEEKTELWIKHFAEKGAKAIRLNSLSGKGIKSITETINELMQEKKERLRQRGRTFVTSRAMIAGIPNVGKSTLMNKFAGKALAKTGDKPGVTRGKQWAKISRDIELLDTPGILWPKFDDKAVGLKLAFTGAIKDEILDIYNLACELAGYLRKLYPYSIKKRYNIDYDEADKNEIILEKIAAARGFMKKGGIYDAERAAVALTDEFRAAKLGKITLESPKDVE